MGSLIKNSLIVLGLLLVAGAGYYLYLQQGATLLQTGTSVSAQVEAETRTFIARQAELRSISLDLRLFEDPRFLGLQSVATPIPELPAGRPNPFEPVDFNTLTIPAPAAERAPSDAPSP